MKRIIIINILLFFACVDVFAQQAIVFKMRYMPGLKYTITSNNDNVMQVDFKGDSAQLKQITANGTQLPIIIQNKNMASYTLKTGSANSQKNFSGIVQYSTIENKELLNGRQISNDINPLTGLEINTVFTPEGKMKADTGAMKTHTDSLKNLVANMSNSILNMVAFPAGAIKPGDTFTQDIPMAVPISGNPIQLNAHIVYKFVAIQNKQALFDINQSVSFKAFTAQGEVLITGKGTGKLFYDTTFNFLKIYQTSLTLNYSMLMGNLTMNGTASILTDYQASITAN